MKHILLSWFLVGSSAIVAAADKPNVLFVISDDLNYALSGLGQARGQFAVVEVADEDSGLMADPMAADRAINARMQFPEQFINLVRNPGHAATVKKLHGRLTKRIQQAGKR